MNRLFLLGAGVVSLVFSGCSWFRSDDKIQQNYWDTLVIPDKYNTGADENTDFQRITDTTVINGVTILYDVRTDSEGKITTNQYLISSNKQNSSFPDAVVIKNYDFSDKKFVIQSSERYSNNKNITFENCKFAGLRNDPASTGTSRVYLTFNHCSFGGGVSSAYITLNDCKIGGFTSDGMNPCCEFYGNNVYVYDLLHEGNQNGSHIDGLQIYGDQSSRNNVEDEKWISKVETGNIHYKNIRFEIPSINFEGNTSYVNACIMFQLEFSDVCNVSFENCWINGGGKWYPIYVDNGKNNDRSVNGAWKHENVSLKNVWVSNTYGKIFYPNIIDDLISENVDHHDNMYVSSIFRDVYGTAHIIASNDTNNDKIFYVKTNKGTWKFEIPHCPSNWALEGNGSSPYFTPSEPLHDASGKLYSEYRWKDFPFDVDYKIPGNPSFVVVYQGENQIRYVKFDGRTHFTSEIDETIRN